MLVPLKGIMRAAGGLAATYAGLSAVSNVLTNTGNFEQANIAFEVMLRSGEKAKKLLKGLYEFSAKTPFEFPEIQSSAKSMLAFGVNSGDVVKKLRMLGDISSAIGSPLGEIAEIYGKAKTQGRLFAEDINQLTGRGIPIIAELAKQFRVPQERIKELVKDGDVGFKHLDIALQALTTGQGRFTGMTEKQSRSLLGLWSTLKDGINMAFVEQTTKAMPGMKSLLQTGIDLLPRLTQELDKAAKLFARIAEWAAKFWPQIKEAAEAALPVLMKKLDWLVNAGKWIVENWSKVKPVLLGIIAVWAAADVILTAQRIALTVATDALKLWNIYLKAAKVRQWLWNTSLLGCPILLIIAGVAALGVGIYYLIKNWDKVKAAASRAWDWFVKFGTEGPGRFIPIVGLIATIAKNWDKVIAVVKKAWDWFKKIASWLAKHSGIGQMITAGKWAAGKIAGKRALGGAVAAGRSYLVGERGPELFRPRLGGGIVPNAALAGAGGGTFTFAPTIQITGNADRGVVDSALRDSEARFKNWYQKMKRDEQRRSFS